MCWLSQEHIHVLLHWGKTDAQRKKLLKVSPELSKSEYFQSTMRSATFTVFKPNLAVCLETASEWKR